MKIIVDSREQKPYQFSGYPVQTEPAALAAGDYSLAGFQDRIAIEWKSLNDLIGCLKGSDRGRFERELAKGRSYERFLVVVEAGLQDVSAGRYISNMKPAAALQSIMAFYIRYGTPFLFCGNRDGGEYVTYSILQKYIYEIGKRFTQAQEARAIWYGYIMITID